MRAIGRTPFRRDLQIGSAPRCKNTTTTAITHLSRKTAKKGSAGILRAPHLSRAIRRYLAGQFVLPLIEPWLLVVPGAQLVLLVSPFGVWELLPFVLPEPGVVVPGAVVVPEPDVPAPEPPPVPVPVPAQPELEPAPVPPAPEPPLPPDPLPAPCAIAKDAKLKAKTAPMRIFFICFPPSVVVVTKIQQHGGKPVPKYIFCMGRNKPASGIAEINCGDAHDARASADRPPGPGDLGRKMISALPRMSRQAIKSIGLLSLAESP